VGRSFVFASFDTHQATESSTFMKHTLVFPPNRPLSKNPE
jgi:hypothetical protein